MKNIFAKRFFSKILAVFLSVCIMTFSGALLVFAGWEHGASNDVLIQILGGTDGKGGYRYSVDIIYYSMAFSFNVRSYEVNTQTGETYITSGVWFMDENKKADVELYVENHADTPISVTAFIDQADFDECNTRVLREGLQREYLPACELTSEGVVISRGTMTLSLDNMPDIDNFKGEKQFYITVYVVPASGETTSGGYFNSNFK
ncbi:MAG: hypothetical protein E7608_04905 [Ruminococcaceae bacterium]|nr:hypothetical protein [Oscillospiraceae bacterium]